MKILELDRTKYVLHGELDAESLICLLDLLDGLREESTGELVEVMVGEKPPARIKKPEEGKSA